MSELSNISGVGSSKTVTNLLKKVEEKLLGMTLDHPEDEEFFYRVSFRFKIDIIKKITINYGQSQERTSQKGPKEEREDKPTEATDKQASGTIHHECDQTDGRCRSQKKAVSRVLTDFYRELRSDFDRQQIYRRRDNKLVVQIFEYFKYLDFDESLSKISNNLQFGVDFIEYNLYICDHKREDDDLILVLEGMPTVIPTQEDQMLLYPMLHLDVDFFNNEYKLTNAGFYTKWGEAL